MIRTPHVGVLGPLLKILGKPLLYFYRYPRCAAFHVAACLIG